MRTSVFVGTSVDDFIARPDGSFDFLTSSGADRDNGYEEFFATVDALIVGRNTYEVARDFPEWPYGSRQVFVLTSRPLELPEGAAVTALRGTPGEVFAHVSALGFEHAYVDGGLTIQSFLRAGLIDRMVITRVPVLIGSGIPLFGSLARDVRLRHVSTREIAGAAVQTEYEVIKGEVADSPPPV